MEQLPPGWYTNERGESRYWDGQSWLQSAGVPPSVDGATAVGRRPRSRLITTLAALAAIAAVGAAAYFVVMDQVDRREATETAAAQARQLAAEKSEQEAAADAERARLDQAERAEKETRAAELTLREGSVEQLESAMEETAQERHEEGFYTDKVLQVRCLPVDGSSIEELDETSTSFSCVAVTVEKDGKYEGYSMSGVINWTSGEMSWQ